MRFNGGCVDIDEATPLGPRLSEYHCSKPSPVTFAIVRQAMHTRAGRYHIIQITRVDVVRPEPAFRGGSYDHIFSCTLPLSVFLRDFLLTIFQFYHPGLIS